MARGGFDYDAFVKMHRSMLKMQAELDEFLEGFLIKQALIALRLVRPRTPVDTGTLRRSWQITDVQIYDSYMTVSLVNPIEYASFMENGFTYSTKSGEGRFPGFHMAELSILQVQQKLPAKFSSAFTSWLKSKGWG